MCGHGNSICVCEVGVEIEISICVCKVGVAVIRTPPVVPQSERLKTMYAN